MKIIFADSFFDSLKRISRHQTWWYKTYEFFRYDIWRFFLNIYRFRKELWNFQPWDYAYNLRLLRRSLELTRDEIVNGHEEDRSRLKKVAKMDRAIELLHNFTEDTFIEQAETLCGKSLILSNWDNINEEDSEEVKVNNREILDKAHELQRAQWEELWGIFKGTRNESATSVTQKKSIENQDTWDEYFDNFDGSDIRGWWD